MPKLLIVDDEEDQEELILQRLREKEFLMEYEFIFARNGLEAINQVKTYPDIEIALMDIYMPEVDGLTAMQKCRSLNPVLTTILISAYDDESNRQAGFANGAFKFIAKPIDFEKLEVILKQSIQKVKQLKEKKSVNNHP